MKKTEKGIQTFLGPQTTLEGKLVFEGTVRIDGHLTGSIESKDGVLIIGETAVVHAEMLVHSATVSGEVRGNIRATHRIELNPPARVFGDLSAPEVIITNVGVVFDGKCSTSPKQDAASKTIKLQQKG
jgi:cytoskeletal protein CcmA (bactofilin family)